MNLEKTIALRVPENWLPEIEKAMKRRGILKISDFVRQAVVAELNHAERNEAAEVVNFATAGALKGDKAGVPS